METPETNNTNDVILIEDKAYWREQIRLYESSGLSRAAHCRLHHIKYERFGYWFKRLKRSQWVPVKLNSTKTSDSELFCTLIFNNGCRLSIHNLQTVSFILKQLS